jgi:NAD(P)-dependent dehydrogenase (short-subunit alcohol dehydrogenase family)
MLERGCKSFVFLSRSGAAKPEAADLVRHLEESGAHVEVFCVDASDEKAVADVVSTVSAQRSIKGVVHAAMVLKVRYPVTVVSHATNMFRTVCTKQ